MRPNSRIPLLFAALSLAGLLPMAAAATPDALLEQWRGEAGPGAAPFAATRGRQLFETQVVDWSCSTCHTADPRRGGRHVVTGKPIEPLAPAANPARFTDAAKVEKWLRRNCRDVLRRVCTPQEKGDLLTWLTSLK